MAKQSTFKTPKPILQKIEQCRLKQEKRLSLRGGTAFGEFLLPIVPPEVFTLTHLEELDLSYNAIQVVPEEIKQLTHLKRFIYSKYLANKHYQIAIEVSSGLTIFWTEFQFLSILFLN